MFLNQPGCVPSVHTFALSLLPVHTRLLLDSGSNTVILLRLEDADLAVSHSFRLTPSAARVFLLLLRSYPSYCSYRSLFQALYPLDQEQDVKRAWQTALALRPIRRALVALAPALRGLGLQAVSLRGQGYILAPHEIGQFV